MLGNCFITQLYFQSKNKRKIKLDDFAIVIKCYFGILKTPTVRNMNVEGAKEGRAWAEE